MSATEITAGLASITYQGDALFKDMVSIIEALRSQQRFTQKGFDKSKLTDVIFERTGLTIEMVIQDTPVVNASVLPPYINPNHVFYKTMIRHTAAAAFAPGFKKLKGERSGWVDARACKIGGWYSDLVSIVTITTAFNTEVFSSEEIASVILHELGHAFYFFFTTHKSIHDVSILSRTIQEASGIKDPMKRRDIILYGMKQMDIDVIDPQTLIDKYDGKNVDDLVTLMYLDAKLKPQEVPIDAEYTQRTFEQLADHFGVMHGAGPELVSALIKLHKSMGSQYTQGTALFIGMEALKLLMTITSPVMGPLVLLYMYFDEAPLTYDELPKRLSLMRQTLVGEIKANFNNVKMIKKLQEDIALIAELEKSIHDRRTLYDIVQSTIVPRIRRMDKQTRQHTAVEGLLYNDLFTAAVMIK